MINKNLLLVIGILSLIVIAGCSGQKKQERPITDVDVRKGLDGLVMEFLPNAPPDIVFAENNFPIAVSLRNKGAYDIDSLEVEYFEEKVIDDPILEEEITIKDKETKIIGGNLVFGLETNFVDVKTQEDEVTQGQGDEVQEIKLLGKSVINPAGDEKVIDINVQAKKIGEQSETQPSTILATACYPYKTVLGTSVCIDPDVIGVPNDIKPCTVADVDFREGQGAPVAITKIETRMLQQDDTSVVPHFILHIENLGNGEVLALHKTNDACSGGALEYKDFNSLKVTAILSGETLTCIPEQDGYIRLKDKKDTIRCVLEKEGGITSTDAYTSPLKVELDYGYTFTISKNIIIEKVTI
jgi:hypothetical protein